LNRFLGADALYLVVTVFLNLHNGFVSCQSGVNLTLWFVLVLHGRLSSPPTFRLVFCRYKPDGPLSPLFSVGFFFSAKGLSLG